MTNMPWKFSCILSTSMSERGFLPSLNGEFMGQIRSILRPDWIYRDRLVGV